MKRTLLIAACSLFLTGMQAQTSNEPTWSENLTGVTLAEDLYLKAPTAVDHTGSIYVTGQFTQPLSIGPAYLEAIANSAYLAKYSASGSPLWAIALQGAATITGIDTDEDGNVYVAGTFADVVVVGSTDNNTQQITGKPEDTEKASSFIAAYNAEGQLKAVRAIYPTANEEVMASGLYWPMSGFPYFKVNHIEASNGKVYVSATHTGDVSIDDVQWVGMYLNIFDFMYDDLESGGVFSLDAATLNGASAIAHVAVSEQLQYLQMGLESINFTENEGTIYLCFVGNGNIKYEAGGKSETIELSYDGDMGMIEHAFVVSSIKGEEVSTRIFHSTPHGNSAAYDVVGAMKVEGGSLYIGGTFHQTLAFDNSKTHVDGNDLFVAALDKTTLEGKWAAQSGLAEGNGDAVHFYENFTTMTVNNGEVSLYGYVLQDQDNKKTITSSLSCTCSNGNATRNEGNLVTGADINGTIQALLSVDSETLAQAIGSYVVDPSAINTVSTSTLQRVGNTFHFAEPSDVKVYNMQGQVLLQEKQAESLDISSLNQGIYILSCGKENIKIRK